MDKIPTSVKTPVELVLDKLNVGEKYVYHTSALHMIMLFVDEVAARRANVLFKIRKFGPNYTLTISQ